jgi:predicted permease
VRQLLSETLLLASAGGLGGIALSLWTTRVVALLLPARLDPVPSVDGRVLLFAVALSAVTALAIGVVPALRAARGDVVGMVQGRGRGARGGRLRDALVVVQVALSLVLVAGAALFARSLSAARSLDAGFDSENVLTVQTNLRNHGYDRARGSAFVVDALARIRALPGVRAVAATRQLPFRGEWTSRLDPPAGVTLPPGQEGIDNVGRNSVSAGYFEVMRIPLVAGRPIMDGDDAGAPPVIVVNETFARTVFPAGDALGRTVPLNDGPPFTIVGIARDATYYELGETPRMQVYSPTLQFFQPSVAFVVRTAGPPLESAKLVQDALHALDPDLAFSGIASLQQIEAEQVASFRASAHVVGLSGFIALLLACAGLYGVMACRVSERTREIGVRLAIGAMEEDVLLQFLVEAVTLSLLGGIAGVLAGLGGAAAGAALLDLPFVLNAWIVAVAFLFSGVVGVLFGYFPARRAARLNPIEALRHE